MVLAGGSGAIVANIFNVPNVFDVLHPLVVFFLNKLLANTVHGLCHEDCHNNMKTLENSWLRSRT